MEESGVRQGFICPFCFRDLGDFQTLQTHVDHVHSENNEEDTLDQLKKGILTHARRIRSQATSLLTERPSTSNSTATGTSFGQGLGANGNHAAQTPPGRQAENQEKLHFHHPPPPIVARLGIRRPRMDEFRDMRDETVNQVAVETNRRIIILDQLINECPSDPSLRRDFERQVVGWVGDRDEKQCSMCRGSFTITRRRHHCRLCGKLICKSCSRFLSFLSARKLTNPALAAQMLAAIGDETKLASIEQDPLERTLQLGGTGGRLAAGLVVGLAKRGSGQLLQLIKGAAGDQRNREAASGGSSGSGGAGGSGVDEVSLGSLLKQDANEHLRVCDTCLLYLSRREEMMEQHNQPAFVSLYEQLTSLITEVSNLGPSYQRMSESLRKGETMYTLESAEKMRRKLAERHREIDSLSKRIAEDGMKSEGAEQGRPPPDAKLRRHIRMVALTVVQESLKGLGPLPTAEEYALLVEKRKSEVARQMALTRQLMADAAAATEAEGSASAAPASLARVLSSPSMPSLSTVIGGAAGNNVASRVSPPLSSATSHSSKRGLLTRSDSGSVNDGWTPMQTRAVNPFVDDNHTQHPLLIQLDNLKSYLKQAAEAGRLDEAQILEQSINDILIEITSAGMESPTI